MRCHAEHPSRLHSRCVKEVEGHDLHLAWHGDEAIVWRDLPPGPANQGEWLKAADVLEDGLGMRFDVYHQEDGPFLMIHPEDLAKWWSEHGDRIMGRECSRDDGCRVPGHKDRLGHHV